MSTDFPVFTKTFHSSVYPRIEPTNPAISAKGKVVVVTGGGRGIGKAIATAFAIAGARAVVIFGRTTSTLEAASNDISEAAKGAGHSTAVQTFTTDICDTAAVSRSFKAVHNEFSAIDIVINNAGDLHLDTIEASDIDAYWKSFDINVKGTLNVIQAFVRAGLDSNRAAPVTFINLSTVGVAMPIMPRWSTYVASKLAAFSMTEFLIAEAGGKLRAFSIHPGRIATDMASKAGVPTFDDAGLPGAFCVWLAATPEADFLQGRLVACNWDVDELLQMKEEIEAKGLLKMAFAGLNKQFAMLNHKTSHAEV